jgi:peptidoglycan hydrolase CwlO-like protein
MLKKIFLVGVCLIAITGCSSEGSPQSLPLPAPANAPEPRPPVAEPDARRQVALSNIKQLEQQISLISQKMLGQQEKISNLELQSNQLETDLRTYNGKIQAFMKAHQQAVVCMSAVGAALDETNRYSQDAKDLAGGVTLVCGVVVLADAKFREEVFWVIDQLNQADSYADNLANQLEAVRSQIITENQVLETDKTEVSRITTDIQNYQSQLGL